MTLLALRSRAELELDRFALDPYCKLYLPFRKLDGNSFADHSAYGHLCTNYGSLWTPQGRSFDGVDDYVEVPFSESINLKKAITFEGWVVIDSVADRRISGSKQTHYRWIDYEAGTGKYQWNVGNGSEWIVAGVVQTWTLPIGEWFHLAYVVDWENGWAKVYLDTVEKSSITFAAGAVAGNTNDLYIGSFATGYFWLGKHDEVRIYNRALTPQEILEHYIVGKEMFR